MQHRSSSPDTVEHLNAILPDPSALPRVPLLLDELSAYKLAVDREIIACSDAAGQRGSLEQIGDNVDGLVESLVEEIRTTQQMASSTEGMITQMTKNIKKLDEAKKNLVLSMTVLKRLQMLTTAYDQLQLLIKQKQYSETLQILSAVKELIQHFKPYRSVSQIAALSKSVSQTQDQLADQIFTDFDDTINRKRNTFWGDDSMELVSACNILDLLGTGYHDKLVSWLCNNQLKEIKSIFKSTDEAGSLENISRRYTYIKHTLKTFEDDYSIFFPENWNMSEELMNRFCGYTREDLKEVLSMTSKDIDIQQLLDALQVTVEFEQYLDRKFKDTGDKKPQRSISEAFQPYLSLWINYQDRILNAEFNKYIDKGIKVDGEILPETVIESSADMIVRYRKLLAQGANLSTKEPLLDLSKMFSRWLTTYSKQILSKNLPVSLNSLNEEAIINICLIINTAHYCSTITTQLEDRIKEIIDPTLQNKVNFSSNRETFINVINTCISLLLNKVGHETELIWKEMTNTNWGKLDQVGDQSTYVTGLRSSIEETSKLILPRISKEVYRRTFCDRVVESVSIKYLQTIIKCRPISEIAAEQLSLDLYALKEIFLKLPSLGDPTSTPAVLYTKRVQKFLNRIEVILKVLLTQSNPPEGLVQNYFYLIADKSIDNFKKILVLKGIERYSQNPFLDIFKSQLKSHENLIDESPVLSTLNIQAIDNILASSSEITTRSSSPIFDGSIFGNAKFPRTQSLTIDKMGIENTLGKLAQEGENHVNKLNENFKSFGRFFKRDNTNNNGNGNGNGHVFGLGHNIGNGKS